MKKGILALSIGAAILAGCSSDNKEIGTFTFKGKHDDKSYGLLNKEGEVIVSEEFKSKPSNISEGMLTIYKSSEEGGGYYKFYEISDKPEAIDGKFKDVLGFSEGLAPVVKEGKEITFINKKGEVVITCDKSIKKASAFFGGFSVVVDTASKRGYMNTEGEIVIPCKYDEALYFIDGLARVMIRKEKKNEGGNSSTTREYSFINDEDETVLDLGSEYSKVAQGFSNGILLVKENDGGWGYLDKDGEELIKCDKDIKYATPFINGMAMVYNKKEKEFRVINEDGEDIVKTDDNLFQTMGSYTFAQERLYSLEDEELVIKDLDGDEIIKIKDVKKIFFHGPNKTVFVKVKDDWASYTIDGERIDEDFDFEHFVRPDIGITYFPYNNDGWIDLIESDYTEEEKQSKISKKGKKSKVM